MYIQIQAHGGKNYIREDGFSWEMGVEKGREMISSHGHIEDNCSLIHVLAKRRACETSRRDPRERD